MVSHFFCELSPTYLVLKRSALLYFSAYKYQVQLLQVQVSIFGKHLSTMTDYIYSRFFPLLPNFVNSLTRFSKEERNWHEYQTFRMRLVFVWITCVFLYENLWWMSNLYQSQLATIIYTDLEVSAFLGLCNYIHLMLPCAKMLMGVSALVKMILIRVG